jgi:hypothetical protein
MGSFSHDPGDRQLARLDVPSTHKRLLAPYDAAKVQFACSSLNAAHLGEDAVERANLQMKGIDHGCNLVLSLVVTPIALLGQAHAQMQRPGVGPTNPNAYNQAFDTMHQMQDLEDQRRRDAQAKQKPVGVELSAQDKAVLQAQVAKFLKAVQRRKYRFPDFDQVVLHGNAPITPGMLGLVAESAYAADVAYYLGKHPEQSATIAQMTPADATLALQQIESTIGERSASRK